MSAGQHDYVASAELDLAPLRLVISPLPTALTLIRDALQNGRRATPSAVRKSILSTLRARDAAALAPLTSPATTGWPTLLDEVSESHETLDDALERLTASSGSAVVEALETDRDVRSTGAWDAVRADPDRWLSRYVDAIRRGWVTVGPLWRRSTPLLEREAERVEAAVERGVPHAQITHELAPRTSLVGGTLRLVTAEQPRKLRVHEEGVVVTPLIASPRAGSLSSPGDFAVRLDYPLTNAWRVFDDQGPPPPSLEALLGVQRAALLELLDRPCIAGELADRLVLARSAITFHVRALEAAGLAYRTPRGRNVIVERTPRGTQLLAMYATP